MYIIHIHVHIHIRINERYRFLIIYIKEDPYFILKIPFITLTKIMVD